LELRNPKKMAAQQLIDGSFSVTQYHLDPSQVAACGLSLGLPIEAKRERIIYIFPQLDFVLYF
jgi:hypothetical protein